jgi:uncharacterized membrane protein
MNSTKSEKILALGRIFYAAGIAGIGVQEFINSDFVPVILPSFPAGLPLHALWPDLGGVFLLMAAAAILFERRAHAAAVILGTAFLAALVLRHLPGLFPSDYRSIASWNNPLKILTLSGGAFVVAASLPGHGKQTPAKVFTAFGCASLAITVGIFGIEHFIYPQFVATLVPEWIPGAMFWTYFCAVALIAAGVGLLFRIWATTAAALLGAMILIWFLVLHIPRAIAMPYGPNGNEWTSVCEALAFSGIAFILALTLPRKSG